MALYEDAKKETINAQQDGRFKEIQQNLQTLVTALVTEGKLAKEDARRILNVTEGDAVQLSEDLKIEVK